MQHDQLTNGSFHPAVPSVRCLWRALAKKWIANFGTRCLRQKKVKMSCQSSQPMDVEIPEHPSMLWNIMKHNMTLTLRWTQHTSHTETVMSLETAVLMLHRTVSGRPVIFGPKKSQIVRASGKHVDFALSDLLMWTKDTKEAFVLHLLWHLRKAFEISPWKSHFWVSLCWRDHGTEPSTTLSPTMLHPKALCIYPAKFYMAKAA